jgi:DNA repair exonuclease SbcCD ATPase subunit
MEAPALKPGLFGYSRTSVRAALEEREVAMARASAEKRDAQARAAELANELDRASRDASDLEKTRNDLRSELALERDRVKMLEDEIAAAAIPAAPGGPPTSQELIDILDSAERTLARLTEEARRNVDEELSETQGARDEVRAEIDRLTTWREGMTNLAQAVRESVGAARAANATLVARLSELAELTPPSATPEKDESAPTTESATEQLIRLEDVEEIDAQESASSRVEMSAAWSENGPWQSGEG